MHNDQRNLETIPLESCREIGEKVDKYLVKWRCVREHEHEDDIAFKGYLRDTYVINASCPRFGSGEAKGMIHETIRGYDLYIMTDVLTNSAEMRIICHRMITIRI